MCGSSACFVNIGPQEPEFKLQYKQTNKQKGVEVMLETHPTIR
jgi:hypothetical protein